MKLTLGELLKINTSLSKLLTSELPANVAFKLSKISKTIREDVKTLEDTRMDLFNKYGEPQDNGTITVNKENLEVFNEENDKLLAEEVEFKFDPIKLSLLEDIKFTANELADLEKFINPDLD